MLYREALNCPPQQNIDVTRDSRFNTILNLVQYFTTKKYHMKNFMKQTYLPSQKVAFTLAEVLITLGIIGVVAAITMPVLIADAREKQTVTKLKKIYSVLSNTYLMIASEKGSPKYWSLPSTTGSDFNASKAMAENFVKKLEIIKDCGSEAGCFPEGYIHRYDGGIWQDDIDGAHHRYKVITKDGISLAFQAYSNDCSRKNVNADMCGLVYVAINGPKDKQIVYGKNFFDFILTPTGIIPQGANMSYSEMEKSCKGLTGYAGNYCTLWVIDKGNMDYLHQ